MTNATTHCKLPLLTILLTLPLTGTAEANDPILIDGPAALKIALSAPEEGQTYLLEGANYGTLDLRAIGGTPARPITISSANPATPAVFTGLELNDVHDIIIDGVILDYRFEVGDQLYNRPFTISDSQRIKLTNNTFDGDIAKAPSPSDNGYPTAYGLNIANSQSIQITRNEFRDFYRGLVAYKSQELTICGNEFHKLRMDGMNFAEVQNIKITSNYLHDFKRSANSEDHADMIQFWTAGTEENSENINISYNILTAASGLYTQSIFMRNEAVDQGLRGKEMFYNNILLEENIILNAHAHGITVGETNGLKIRNNTVLYNPAAAGKQDNPPLWTPQIYVAPSATNVEIIRNAVAKINGPEGQADWKVEANVTIQNRTRAEAGHYSKEFLNYRDSRSDNIDAYYYKPGGSIAASHAGAARLSRAGTNNANLAERNTILFALRSECN